MAQLDLWPSWVRSLPWEGRSPRSLTLTKAPKVLFLRREPQKEDRFFVDPNQTDLWPPANKAPEIYSGAPLLMRFEREGK